MECKMVSGPDLVQHAQDIKTLPQIPLQLCQLTADDNSTVQDIEALLRMDPILVARLLQLVNSAYYSRRYPIDDLTKAIMVIGIKALRNLVLLDALKNFFRQDNISSIIDAKQLWLHCAAVGFASKLLSRRLLGLPGEDAFLAGILHDIGLILEVQYCGETFLQVLQSAQTEPSQLIHFEQAYIGTDHCEVGSLLTATWGLPDLITQSISQHHKMIETYSPCDNLGHILQLAHYLAVEGGYGVDWDSEGSSSEALAAYIGCNAEEFSVLFQDFVADMQAAAHLYQDGPA